MTNSKIYNSVLASIILFGCFSPLAADQAALQHQSSSTLESKSSLENSPMPEAIESTVVTKNDTVDSDEDERTVTDAVGSIALRVGLYLVWCRAVHPAVDQLSDTKWLQTAVGDIGKIIIAAYNQKALTKDIELLADKTTAVVKSLYSLAAKKLKKEQKKKKVARPAIA